MNTREEIKKIAKREAFYLLERGLSSAEIGAFQKRVFGDEYRDECFEAWKELQNEVRVAELRRKE